MRDADVTGAGLSGVAGGVDTVGEAATGLGTGGGDATADDGVTPEATGGLTAEATADLADFPVTKAYLSSSAFLFVAM
jgi:hypothetical protein